MRFILLAIFNLCILFFSDVLNRRAYAYLDSGTGSYLFQLIIGALIGGLFAVKLFWRRILSFFRDLFHKKKEENE